MNFYLAHQIEYINLKECWNDETFERYTEKQYSKMVDEEKRLKVISSETPIELGEEITETHNEEINYQDFNWEEKWIVIEELHPNFWRM